MKPLNIIYEDNHLIVVEKPVGLLSQGDHTGDSDLLNHIKQYIKITYNKPGNVFLGLVHRLDRMVGGVMVFAKTSKAASRLSDQIRTRQFTKKYLAVVHGVPPKEQILIHYLWKDQRKNYTSVVPKDHQGAKYAELGYRLLESRHGLSLVDIDLKTGRSHQIRVQFKEIGHPLYGDKRYGNPQDTGDISLYAYQLSLIHPTKKEEMTFKILPTSNPFNLFSMEALHNKTSRH